MTLAPTNNKDGAQLELPEPLKTTRVGSGTFKVTQTIAVPMCGSPRDTTFAKKSFNLTTRETKD